MDAHKQGGFRAMLDRITQAIAPKAVREARAAAEDAAAKKAASQGTLNDVAKRILEDAEVLTAGGK